jgi:hypothetical protein
MKTNCLIFLICWLREASAHYDFMASDVRARLQDFLSQILRTELKNPQLCAAARKVQVFMSAWCVCAHS